MGFLTFAVPILSPLHFEGASVWVALAAGRGQPTTLTLLQTAECWQHLIFTF